MPIINEGYLPRCLDDVVRGHLRAFGAVEIAGTMWSGKTWTSEAHAESEIVLDSDAVISAVVADPQVALAGSSPHLIDEWQEVPAIWDTVRHEVDRAAGRRGLYILSGSSRPAKQDVRHTGAGRISRLRMRPMSLFESGESDGTVSLEGLFRGEFESGQAVTSLSAIASAVYRGGWPGALGLDEDVRSLVPAQYLDALIEGVVRDTSRDPDELRRLLLALARNTGEAATKQTLANDSGLTLSNGKPNESVIDEWLGILRRRYVIEELKGWDAPIKSPARLRTKPKRYFVDPSLTAALVGVSPERLLLDGQLFGRLFEEMCLRDLRVYASCIQGAGAEPLRYYRDSDGLEVDAIIELVDGRWAAIEVKLGSNKVPEAVHSLCRLRTKVMNNPAARNPQPCFMAVVVGKGDVKYRTEEGVYVLPLSCLRP